MFSLFGNQPTSEESLVGFFTDMDEAVEWARGVLKDTGTDPEKEFVKAIKDIRTAKKRLGLLAATHLIKEVNNRS